MEGVTYTVPYCIKESYKEVLVYSAGDTCIINFLLGELPQELIAELAQQKVNVFNTTTGERWTEDVTLHSSEGEFYVKYTFSPTTSNSLLLASVALFFGEEKLSTLPIKIKII